MNTKICNYKNTEKYLVVLMVFQFVAVSIYSQQCYDDFEGMRKLHYGDRIGVLDSSVKNPAPDITNNSLKCALYVRNGAKKFANIKMNLKGKLTGVEAYATYEGEPPTLKLKVFTSAPVGTLVELLLGAKRLNNDYPAGTHSQYQAYTTKSNEWEELIFKFSQIPQGSETSTSQIDQIVLLFNPNTSNSDTYYFDDLTGPALVQIEKKKPVKQNGDQSADPKKSKLAEKIPDKTPHKKADVLPKNK
jgi:hypothetical protein